jgi:hypothetical protein
MKHLNYIWLTLLAAMLTACGDDDEPVRGGLPFSLELKAEVVEGYTQRQPIYTGNGDYTISMADPQIASAEYVPSKSGLDFGAIVVTGRKQGSTVMTVTDTQAGKSLNVDLKVISPNFHMVTPVTSGHKALAHDVVWCLVPSQKAERDVMFFRSDGVGLHFLTRGTYRTEDDGKGHTRLVMSYPMTASDSTLSTAADAPMTIHRFHLDAASPTALSILTATAPLSTADASQTATVELTEEVYGRKLAANIVYGPLYQLIIPFGYLE